jgi:hypothetical protein
MVVIVICRLKHLEQIFVFKSSVVDPDSMILLIRIELKCWILIRIESIRIHNPGIVYRRRVVVVQDQDSPMALTYWRPLVIISGTPIPNYGDQRISLHVLQKQFSHDDSF